ncbi:MAG: hypothetical protein NVSMB3_09920 [Acidobacteriaceae bacterium]
MDDATHNSSRPPEPRGFGEHSRGLAGEYAHEQGWGLNEEERRAQPVAKQEADGGKDYDFGAQDLGDQAVHTSVVKPSSPAVDPILKD